MQNTNVNERIQLQKARTMNTFKNQNDNKNTNLRIQSQSKGFGEERRRRRTHSEKRRMKNKHRRHSMRTNITRFGSDLGFNSQKWRDDGRIWENERTKLRKVFRVLRTREWRGFFGVRVYCGFVILLKLKGEGFHFGGEDGQKWNLYTHFQHIYRIATACVFTSGILKPEVKTLNQKSFF
jgi:hypothetical protein